MRGPIAQTCVEFVRLLGSKIVGADATRPSGKLSRAERKSQGATESARANREIMAGTVVVSGVAVLIIALFVLQANGGVDGGGGVTPQSIIVLKLSDVKGIRSALFGAKPVVIECSSPSVSGKSLLREAALEALLPSAVVAASIACDEPIGGSGDSLIDRFKLSRPASPSAPPLLLQAGHGLAAPVALGRQPSVASLVRHLKRWSQPHMALLNSTLDLQRHCLSRPACLLLLTRGTAPSVAKQTLLKAVSSLGHRDLGLATLNRKTHTATFTAQVPETSRAVLLALRSASSAGPLLAEARAFRGVLSSDEQMDVDAFVATVARGSAQDFNLLEKPPRISPADHKASEAMADEELYDPLLSSKRFERETALL